MSSRRQARIIAFQTIYQRQKIGVQEDGEARLLRQFPISHKHLGFFEKLRDTTWNQLPIIDKQIRTYLVNWKQDRISDSLNALMRVAVGELLFFPETDGKVVFNEAIEICRSYVDKDATGILNGVLHSVWKNRKDPDQPS